MSLRESIKKAIPTVVFDRVEPYAHLGENILISTRHGLPARNMRFIGVTGTNGKTTTTNMIFTMLREADFKVALLSSTTYGYRDDLKEQVNHMTTDPAPILQRKLRSFAAAGAEWVVVEASSHALAQHRMWGLPIEIAVMTNVTHEHLDYHKTFERYREAKRRLFKIAAKHGLKYGVVNADDPAAELFAATVPESESFGLYKGDVVAQDVVLGSESSSFTAVAGKDKYKISIKMPGEFNVQNALAAVTVGRKLGLSKNQIEAGLAAFAGVEGRMMRVDEGQAYMAMIDYAGTPDAFQRAFETLRTAVKGKLVVVFGSPAHRDKLKRPIQGEIAGRYADEVILTEEDDRDEPGQEIMEQMAAGAEKVGKIRDKDLFLIGNRKQAIEFAVSRVSHADDLVITLGKGHERTIERADGIYPWNEAETLREAIRSRAVQD